MKNIYAVLCTLALLIAPSLAHGAIGACSLSGQITDLNSVLCKFVALANFAVPFILALGVIFVLWSAFGLIRADGPDARKEAGSRVAWGIVGLFVMVSVWGLVAFVSNSLGFSANRNGTLRPPQIQIQSDWGLNIQGGVQ